MRRVLSVILFAIGGWLLMAEPLIAFIRPDSASSSGSIMVVMLALFLLLGLAPILVGAAISPGDRLKEVGLTILIAMGVALACALSVVAIFVDPGAKPFLPPLPKFDFTPILGVVNLLVLTAAGLLLYRRRSAGN